MAVAVQNIERPEPSLVEEFSRFGVATIHEAQGRAGYLGPSIRPIYPGAHVAGPATTVRVPPGDNWMIHVAVELTQPGDVLVVAPTSSSDAGYFGELLATALMVRKVRGLIIDGGCRDVAELRQMGFPVWSRHISATGTVKETLGDVNVPIVCGGQLVMAGDIVVADDDGVVVVPRLSAPEVARSCQRREDREAAVRDQYRRGELSLDVGGMRDRLAAKGLRYVESVEDL